MGFPVRAPRRTPRERKRERLSERARDRGAGGDDGRRHPETHRADPPQPGDRQIERLRVKKRRTATTADMAEVDADKVPPVGSSIGDHQEPCE